MLLLHGRDTRSIRSRKDLIQSNKATLSVAFQGTTLVRVRRSLERARELIGTGKGEVFVRKIHIYIDRNGNGDEEMDELKTRARAKAKAARMKEANRNSNKKKKKAAVDVDSGTFTVVKNF